LRKIKYFKKYPFLTLKKLIQEKISFTKSIWSYSGKSYLKTAILLESSLKTDQLTFWQKARDRLKIIFLPTFNRLLFSPLHPWSIFVLGNLNEL
jgi:hypothetical protein